MADKLKIEKPYILTDGETRYLRITWDKDIVPIGITREEVKEIIETAVKNWQGLEINATYEDNPIDDYPDNDYCTIEFKPCFQPVFKNGMEMLVPVFLINNNQHFTFGFDTEAFLTTNIDTVLGYLGFE